MGDLLSQLKLNFGSSPVSGGSAVPTFHPSSAVLGSSTQAPQNTQVYGPPSSYANKTYGPPSYYAPSQGSGVSNPNTNTNNNPSQAQTISAAQLAQQQALANFNNLRSQLSNQLSGLNSNKNDLLSQIGSSYDTAIQNAQNAYQSNLDTLNHTHDTVQNQYADQAKGEANDIQAARDQANSDARALGVNGSYAAKLLDQVTSQGQQGMGTIRSNEANQLGQIADAISSASTDYTTKYNQLQTLEAQAKQQVTDQYQQAYNQIQNYMAQTGVDQTNQLNSIASEMQSTLDNISYLMGTYKQSVLGSLGQNATADDLTSKLNTITQSVPSTVNNYVVDPTTGQTMSAVQADINQTASPDALSSIIGLFNPNQLQRNPNQPPYQQYLNQAVA